MSDRTADRMVRALIASTTLVLTAFVVYFALVYFSVWRHAHTEEARQADSIVVFGAAQYDGRPSPVWQARLDHALGLYQKGFAPRIITTGGQGEGATFTESEVGREYLSRQGVPAEFVTVETVGVSTAQSAAAVAEIMDRMELQSCIVVSDDYHIFRIKRMLEDRGFAVYGSPRGGGSPRTWDRARLYARESLGYILWRVGIRM